MNEKAMSKLKEKHGAHKMSPEYKDAKKGMLQALIKHMSGMAGEGMKKVSVLSDSKEGLQHGLDKAKEVLGEHIQPGTHDELKETPMQEAEETPEEQKVEDETGTEMHDGGEMQDGPSLTPGHDEIDRQIAELMAKKAALRK